ncbi:PhzF family phenazine biosynthesis protein [Neisseria weaveri]|uniref:PhzF family phenazine biosynthesis protein n=1 Tax=Neisseria weaveri TaxID=28091 RepID=UPI000D320DD1|nr:PhzF family phenazine biosynthesis protein [Neisseria weaveri]
MRRYDFYLVNVFAESHFGGNPLAVFPNAEGLDDAAMQAVARQFNLSETVFAFPSDNAAANLRIFTPAHELPLAGHPVLGCAFVLQKQRSLVERFTLNTQAKPVAVRGADGLMTMQIQGYTCTASCAGRAQLAAATGLAETDIAERAYWVNSGSPQLLLQVAAQQALANVQVNYAHLEAVCRADQGRTMIYLWCEHEGQVSARMFYAQNGAILEDSGTGSACANLGAYLISCGRFPFQTAVCQGEQTGRTNYLYLQTDGAENIFVGGRVVEVGQGTFLLPESV